MRSLPMQRACLELRVASVAEIGPGPVLQSLFYQRALVTAPATASLAIPHTGSYLLCVLDLETVI
jgi:hypothetical protein